MILNIISSQGPRPEGYNGLILPGGHIISSVKDFGTIIFALSKRRIKILVNPFFTYLGEVSYSSYLVHFAVIMALERFHFVDYIDVNNKLTGILNYTIRFLLILSCTMIIATLFYRFVELPMQKVGRNLIRLLNVSEVKTPSER